MRLASRFWVLILLLLGAAGGAVAQGIPVQAPVTCGGVGSTATSYTCAYGSANVVGDTLIAIVGQSPNPAASPSTIAATDSNSNTWVSAGCTPVTTGGGYDSDSCLLYASSVVAGANTVTVTTSKISNALITILEFSGLGAIDGSGGFNSSNGGGWPVSTSLTASPSAGTADLLIGYGFQDFGNGGYFYAQTPGFQPIGTGAGSTYFQIGVYVQVASAGTYSFGVNHGSGSNYRTQHVGVVAFHATRPTVPTLGTVQNAVGAGDSITSVTTVNLPYDTVAGNTLIAAAQNGNGAGLASVTGCGQTWQFLAQDETPSHLILYYAPNITSVAAGSCSVTFNYGGTSGNYAATLNEVAGILSAYPLAQPISSSGSGWTSPATINLQEPNLFLFDALGITNTVGGPPSSLFVPSSGYTAQAVSQYDNNTSAVATSENVSSSRGAYTSSPTWTTAGGNAYHVLVAFRHALTSPSVLQIACNAATTGTSVTVTPNTLVPPAHTTRVLWFTTATLTGISVSDANGDVFQASAANSWSIYQWIYYANNARGGAVTISDGVSGAHEVCMADVYGVAPSFPVWGQSTYYTFISSTTVSSGSVSLPSGPYLLLGAVSRTIQTTPYATTNWGMYFSHLQSNIAFNGLEQIDVQYVPSGGGTYNHNVLASSSVSEKANSIIALGLTDITNPRAIQNVPFGLNGFGTLSAPLLSPIKYTGDTVMVHVLGNSTSAILTCSDSQLNTFTPLAGSTSTTGTNYAIYRFNAVAGADTVTCTQSGATEINFNLVEYTPMLDTDCVSTNWNASTTTLASGNCAVTNASDLVTTFGSWNDGTHAGLDPDSSWINPRALNNDVEGGAEMQYDQFPGTTGNFAATWTASKAVMMNSTVVALVPGVIPPPTGGQPFVQVIIP